MARLRRKPMVKNGDYFLNYINSKSFDVNLKFSKFLAMGIQLFWRTVAIVTSHFLPNPKLEPPLEPSKKTPNFRPCFDPTITYHYKKPHNMNPHTNNYWYIVLENIELLYKFSCIMYICIRTEKIVIHTGPCFMVFNIKFNISGKIRVLTHST